MELSVKCEFYVSGRRYNGKSQKHVDSICYKGLAMLRQMMVLFRCGQEKDVKYKTKIQQMKLFIVNGKNMKELVFTTGKCWMSMHFGFQHKRARSGDNTGGGGPSGHRTRV